jgi:DNA/RNA endonuclease YhcR with UshA esterase domain
VLPTRVTTAQIGEGTEGRLVELQARIAQPIGSDLPFGYRLFVADGAGEIQAYVYASTNINLNGLQPGQQVRVVGLSGQYADHYELWPRSPGDIRRIR